MYYKLEDKKVIEVETIEEAQESWANRNLWTTRDLDGGLSVSTIFLTINHGLDEEPLVFETALIFESGDISVLDRHSTYEEAEKYHKETVAKYGG